MNRKVNNLYIPILKRLENLDGATMEMTFNLMQIENGIILKSLSRLSDDELLRYLDYENRLRKDDFIEVYIYSYDEIKKSFYVPEWRRNEIKFGGIEATDKELIWHALTQAFIDCLNIDVNCFSPEKLSTGKLVLEKYHVSLSHSGGRFMVAISNKNIGCDIQKNSEGRYYHLRPEADVWSEREKQSLLDKKDNPFLCFAYWSRKESLYKYLDPGIKFDENNKKKIDTFDYLNLFSSYDCDYKGFYFSVCSELVFSNVEIAIHCSDEVNSI